MKKALEVVNRQGQVVTELPLDNSLIEGRFSPSHFSTAYYCQAVKERILIKAFHEKKKTRGDTAGSGKKVHRQKRLGRARQGHNRAPHRKGGGIAFPPTGELKRPLKLNKKSKQKALLGLIREKIKSGGVVVTESFNLNQNFKTKEAEIFLGDLKQERSTLIVFSRDEEDRELKERSFRNIKRVKVSNPNDLNLLDVFSFKSVLFSQKSFEETTNRLVGVDKKLEK